MIEQPFCRVDSSIVKGKILMTVSFLPTRSTINPSSKQREVIFWQNWLICRSIPQIRPIPRIPILSLIGISSVKNFQENSLTPPVQGILDTLEQLFPTKPIDFPKVPVCSPGSQISNSGLINNSDIGNRNHLLTLPYQNDIRSFKEKNGPVLPQPT